MERPLDLFGVAITPRLVQRVLADLGEDQNQLPVLQHALNRTHHFWKEEGAPVRWTLDSMKRPVD